MILTAYFHRMKGNSKRETGQTEVAGDPLHYRLPMDDFIISLLSRESFRLDDYDYDIVNLKWHNYDMYSPDLVLIIIFPSIQSGAFNVHYEQVTIVLSNLGSELLQCSVVPVM